MQRLAALVPRPRLHLIRFKGVLAPNAKLRARLVPQQPEPPAQASQPAECVNACFRDAMRRKKGRLKIFFSMCLIVQKSFQRWHILCLLSSR
jgi:Fe-S-cluster-containing hydrogenase component 2